MLAVYRKNAFTRLATSLKKQFSIDINKEISLLADQLFTETFVSIENQLRELDLEMDSFIEKSLKTARPKALIKVKKTVLKRAAC